MHFACTIASRNYLAYLRVFATSFRRHNPDGRVIACIVGRKPSRDEYANEPFEVVHAEDLGIARFEAMAFRYDVVELSTALKPYLLAHLHEHLGAEHACYFDPDILVLDDLEELYREVASHDVVLTPHVTAPIDDLATPGEVDLLRSGIYNLGFLGVRFNTRTLAFLRWWQDRLYTLCRHDVTRGLFVDQKWMDFAPAFLDDVHVLRDPGYNVAYWNLRHRTIARDANRWTANGKPLRFFHFSGLDLTQPELISKYQPERTASDHPDAAPLLALARQSVLAAGHRELLGTTYDFASFDNGVPIPHAARLALLDADPRGERWPHPSRTTGRDTFIDYLAAGRRSSAEGIPHIPEIALVIRELNPWAAHQYRDPLGASRDGFALWFVTDGARQHALPDVLVAKTRAELPLPYRRRALQSAVRQRVTSVAIRYYLSLKRRSPGLALSLKRLLKKQASAVPSDRGPEAAGLNVIGWMNAPTGVGESARGFVAAATAAAIPNAALTLGDHQQSSCLEAPYDVSLYCANADMIEEVARLVPSRGRRKVGVWYWELEHLPLWYAQAFKALDEVWAPTRFCLDAFRPLASVPLRHVPPCVPKPLLQQPLRPREAEGRFLLFFAFDARSVPERKNPNGLLSAFRRAVSMSPVPLHLAIRVNHAGEDPACLSQLERAASGLPVTFLTGPMDRATVDGYFAGCDAYVALHRSEGFGLPLVEAMYARKPVIATHYGGVTDFLDDTTGWCVPFEKVQLEQTVGPYPRGATWAQPDVEVAASLIVSVAAGGEENRSRIEAALARVTSMYAPEAAGKRLAAELQRLRQT